MKYNHFGLRRSGLHAITGWLLDHKVVRERDYVTDVRIPVNGKHRRYKYKVFESPEPEDVIGYIEDNPNQCSFVQMRDPYNWLASRILKKVKVDDRFTIAEPEWICYCAGLWTKYAKITFEGGWGENCCVWINYNQWFVDSEYRKLVAFSLGFQTDGRAWLGVRREGYGSSFDDLRFRGKANEMGVLIRYKMFVTDEQYCSYVTDEMVYYGEQLFGMKRPW